MKARAVQFVRLAALAGLLSFGPVGGAAALPPNEPLTWHVRMKTDTWAGQKVLVALVLRTTDSEHVGNFVRIRNFAHDGTTGPIEALGGQVTGDIVARLNPAPLTTMKTLNGWLNGALGETFPETHLMLNFAYTPPGGGAAAALGTYVDFDIEVQTDPIFVVGTYEFPEELACYVLSKDYVPAIPTAEGLGSHALFALSIGVPATWELGYYSPTQLRSGHGQDPDTLFVDFGAVSPPVGGGGGGEGGEDDPPIINPAPRWVRTDPNPTTDVITLRFTLAAPSPWDLDIYDVKGRRVRRFGERLADAGEKVQVWRLNDEAGRRVPAGIYFAKLRNDAGGVVRKFVVTDP